MTLSRTTLMIAISLCLVLQHAASAEQEPPLELEGKWAGEVSAIESAELSGALWNHEFEVSIDGDSARVSFRKDGAWHDKGIFQVNKLKTSAVLTQISSGKDENCRWVETWVLAIHRVRAARLSAFWYRFVDNYVCHGENDGQYGSASAGTIRSVQ